MICIRFFFEENEANYREKFIIFLLFWSQEKSKDSKMKKFEIELWAWKTADFLDFPNEIESYFNALGKVQNESKLKIQFIFELVLELKISNFGKNRFGIEVAKVADFWSPAQENDFRLSLAKILCKVGCCSKSGYFASNLMEFLKYWLLDSNLKQNWGF